MLLKMEVLAEASTRTMMLKMEVEVEAEASVRAIIMNVVQ